MTAPLITSCTDENVRVELFSYFRWVMQGPFDLLSLEKKSSEAHKRAVSLTQSTVAMCHKKLERTRMTAEMPQQLAIGLSVHQAVRSKELISLLHGFGMSVAYSRVQRVESQIESNAFNEWSRMIVSISHQTQGPRSNFEIGEGGGGGTISASILGGHKTLLLTNSL